jgi:YD repeat-containing protein
MIRNGGTQINLGYEFDDLDRLLSVKNGGLNGSVMVTYTYNLDGRRSLLTYANGVTASYQYFDNGLLKQLENKRGSVISSKFTYAYRLDGNQIKKTGKDNKTCEYQYDLTGRLIQEDEQDWHKIAYQYDRFNNRSKMTVTDWNAPSKVETTVYDYDARNRLLTETKTDTKGKTEYFRYTYDYNGRTNPLSRWNLSQKPERNAGLQ